MMSTHKQVEIRGIEVDERLAELLPLLWDNDIATQYSCQGGPSENAYILFATVKSAFRFIERTLQRTGFYGCFTSRLKLELFPPADTGWVGWRPMDDFDQELIRAHVAWPFEFTTIWTQAWRGEEIEWKAALDQANAVHCDHQEQAHA